MVYNDMNHFVSARIHSRRSFLRVIGSVGVLPARQLPKPLFEEVPGSVSGLKWVHENAMSPARYLPETMGPGCALLDYDNDGWMDLYLVNSGASDFFKPSKP